MEREARSPKVGRDVRVIKFRAVPVGTEGRVPSIEVSRFAPRRRSTTHAASEQRVLLVTADGTRHWTSLANVAVINPAQYEEHAGQGRCAAGRAVLERAWGLTAE